MDKQIPDIAFNRSKIFEKLAYSPEPPGYTGRVPWIVQNQISATNGIQYGDIVGKLKDYPRYELPVNKTDKGLMLDIGNGWGRWLVAGADKGYIPIGIDLRLEFCQVARETLTNAGYHGYSVVADLEELPFRDDIFDLVWSFSVIQHTHKKRLMGCLKNIYRILLPGAFTKLEFPNKDGIRNRRGLAKLHEKNADDYNSWVVRYYSIAAYKEIFTSIFNNFDYTNHSFIGIGVLKEDLKYVSLKNKILCGISLTGSLFARLIPSLKKKSDSIYITAKKEVAGTGLPKLEKFYSDHLINPFNNLNIVPLLQCPVSSQQLVVSEDKNFLITTDRKIKYPVINNIPIMVRSEAITVE